MSDYSGEFPENGVSFQNNSVIRPGTRLGRYRIRRHLSSGGMAQVYLADMLHTDDSPLRPVAVKLIHSHLAQDAGFLQKFEYEARLCGRIIHENIVQLLDYNNSSDQPFLVMEYVEGAPLDRIMAWASRNARPLPLATSLSLLEQMLRALAYAHSLDDPHTGKALHVVHRDLKPSNILINRRGIAKIADFGIARAADRPFETDAGVLQGTASYMAPEQLKGLKSNEPGLDLWGVGVILYEMLQLKPLFSGSLAEVISRIVLEDVQPRLNVLTGIPAGLKSVLCKLLAQRVELRYQAAKDVLSDVAPLRREAGDDNFEWHDIFDDMAVQDETLSAHGFRESAPRAERKNIASDNRTWSVEADVADFPTVPLSAEMPELLRMARSRIEAQNDDEDCPTTVAMDPRYRNRPARFSVGLPPNGLLDSGRDVSPRPINADLLDEIPIPSFQAPQADSIKRSRIWRPLVRLLVPTLIGTTVFLARGYLERRSISSRSVRLDSEAKVEELILPSPLAGSTAPSAVGHRLSSKAVPASAGDTAVAGVHTDRGKVGIRTIRSADPPPISSPIPKHDDRRTLSTSPTSENNGRADLRDVTTDRQSLALLTLSARPDAEIHINGQAIDSHSLQQWPLTPGSYRVTLTPTNRLYAPITFDLEAKAGREIKRIYDFRAREWVVRE